MFDQNGNYVPEWVQMGEDDQQPDLAPFAQALKKRFASKPAMPQGPAGHIDTVNTGSGHEAGFGGGGMKSL